MIRAGNSASTRRPSALAIGGCVLLGITGIFSTLGCLLALYVEFTGGLGALGGPAYTAWLVAGALAGVIVPVAVCFAVLRTSHRPVIVAAVLAAVVVAIAVLGITGP